MPTEYNKSRKQSNLKKKGEKIHHCIILYCFFRGVISKTRTSCFITKRPRAFICFLVFGNRDETLALVFEIALANFMECDKHIGQMPWGEQY